MNRDAPFLSPAYVSKAGLVALVAIPLVVLLALSIAARFWLVDPAWMQAIHARHDGFLTTADPFCWVMYHLGPKPALLWAIGALLLFGASFRWREKLARSRRVLAMAFLVMLVGPGLVVNSIFKDNFGRPRPVQTEMFGGELPFRAVGEMGERGVGRSFPSGHASMGYYLMWPFFLLLTTRPRLAWSFMALGIVAGLTIGYSRMLMGGHWPTDVLWSGGMVYFSGLLVAVCLGLLRVGSASP